MRTPSHQGFTDISNNERQSLADAAANYIRKPHERPYFMWLNFINPHDICYMAINGFPETRKELARMTGDQTALAVLRRALALPEGVGEDEFFARHYPPLPPN